MKSPFLSSEEYDERAQQLYNEGLYEEALVLEPDHEDALAGLGEVLLKFGQREAARGCFNRILDLGYQDDVELMLQVGRTLFREGFFAEAKEFFDVAVEQTPDNAEAVALVGYAQH